MLKKQAFKISALLTALLILSFGTPRAQVPHTVLGMICNDDESIPAAGDIILVAYMIDVSDGGVRSETRTNFDTGNAYGNGVMGDGWFELECANFTQFPWDHGDSLRLALVNTANDQLFTMSILLDAAVEPQIANPDRMCPFLQDICTSCANDQVTLEWSVEGESTPVFHVFRSASECGSYQRITQEPIAMRGEVYTFTDPQVTEGETYWYRLGLAEFSDDMPLFNPIQVTASTGVAHEVGTPVPTTYTLFQNYPNPFNPETTIEYQVAENAPVRLVVYNLLGQQVRTLVDEAMPAGRYKSVWNGRDEWGGEVASGVYFCRLEASSYTNTTKMTLLR
jgi:hypothetical protein